MYTVRTCKSTCDLCVNYRQVKRPAGAGEPWESTRAGPSLYLTAYKPAGPGPGQPAGRPVLTFITIFATSLLIHISLQ